MPYERPSASLNQVDKAGFVVCHSSKETEQNEKYYRALLICDNWRIAHAFPLNCTYVTLSRRVQKIDPQSVTSQRLKRFRSLVLKLLRNNSMQLSQMQDIGGCRAVVKDMDCVSKMVEIYDDQPIASKLVRTTDYIAFPKVDGYRSIHRMFRFAGRAQSAPWNGMRIEMQIRTQLQHE